MAKQTIYNAGIYVRLSQEDMRAGESLSIENQKLILTKYVKEQGWNLIDIYVDDGYSGTDFDRPGVQRLLDDAKVGKINLIICKDLSRFGRNYIEVGRYVDYIFPSYNIRFIALNDNVDTANKDSSALDMMPIVNLFNEWHAASTSKKIKAVIEANAKAGKYRTTFAPYGYLKGDDPNHLPVIDPEAAPIVLRMFQMRAKGITPRHIADAFNDEHIMPPLDHLYKLLGRPCPKKTSHLWDGMEQEGYTFKDGKYISVKAPGQQRFVRLKTLGDNYTPEHIDKRVAEQKQKSVIAFAEHYQTIIINIKDYSGAYKNTSAISTTCGKYMRMYQIITQEKIAGIGMVSSKLSQANKKYSDILKQVQELKDKITTIEYEIKSANYYFDEMNVMQRRFPKKEQDKAAVEVIKAHGIKKKEDISALSEQLEKCNADLAKLSEQLSSAGGDVRKYKEISDTYDMMNSGEDYISRLVREAKDKTTSDEWNNMITEQRKIILSELDENISNPMSGIERQLREKIAELRTMNVEPYEVEKLIKVLAVLKIDNALSLDEIRKMSGRVKQSAKTAQKQYNDLQDQVRELNTIISRADVYLRYKDEPNFNNPGFLEMCRKIAEENGASDSGGFERLISKRDNLQKQADELSRKNYYYRHRAEDYDSIISAIENINHYPPERTVNSANKNPPKKKHRR